jgi:hypothetical protein
MAVKITWVRGKLRQKGTQREDREETGEKKKRRGHAEQEKV